MKKIFLALALISFLASCDEASNKKFTVSCPYKSGQMRYYFHTDKFSIGEDGCITFVPQEDSTQEYTICNNYDIERN